MSAIWSGVVAGGIDELREKGAEEDQRLRIADGDKQALQEKSAARDHGRLPGLDAAAGMDHLPAHPDQIGCANEAHPFEPVAHALDDGGQADAGNGDHDGDADLRACNVEQAGARAVAHARRDDQRDGRPRHQDEFAADFLSGHSGLQEFALDGLAWFRVGLRPNPRNVRTVRRYQSRRSMPRLQRHSVANALDVILPVSRRHPAQETGGIAVGRLAVRDHERQMMRRQGVQVVAAIENSTRGLSPIAPRLAVKDALYGFTDERCREGIDVPPLRGDSTDMLAVSHHRLDQKDLGGSTLFIRRLRRWRRRIPNVTKSGAIEIGAELG